METDTSHRKKYIYVYIVRGTLFTCPFLQYLYNTRTISYHYGIIYDDIINNTTPCARRALIRLRVPP